MMEVVTDPDCDKGKYFSGQSDRRDLGVTMTKRLNVARHVFRIAQLVRKFNLKVLAKMSDDEMNIDEGNLFDNIK